MLRSIALILTFSIVLVSSGSDEGPEDPEFTPNDGDLESDINPLKTPSGNYHIIKDEDEVVVLNRDTFFAFVKPKPLVLVKFYAPWCGHCKALAPEFAKASKELSATDIFCVKVDGSIESELAKEFMVQGFPTLLVFRYGDKSDTYEGPRTSESIVSYMKKQNDPNWKPRASVVTILSQNNFTKFVNNQKLTLVMFYAPWCKHCKQIIVEYEGAASELKSWGISLAKVDGTQEKELADNFEISGWPSFKMFRKGRVYEYKNGPREKANIVEYMKEQFKPPSQEKSHYLGLTNNMDRYDVSIIGFFESKNDLYDEYIVAANEMRGTFTFLHTYSVELSQSFHVPMNSIVVFQPEIFWSPYENKTQILHRKSATSKDISLFIHTASLPLVGQRTKKNLFKYNQRPLIVLYYDVNYEHQYVKDTQFIRNKIVEVAKDFVGSNLRFAISSEEEFENEIRALGLEDSGSDVNIGCYTENQKFRMVVDGEFEGEHLSDFISKLRTGTIKPYMKSLPSPHKQEGILLKIVANNYDEEIHRIKKDAVLFVHAPWCGHCKVFDPIFKKVAKALTKNNDNIVFGKMDGDANDIPYMFPSLKGFPTLFFISAYEKFDPLVYQGDFNYKSVRDWINRHSSIFLTEEERTGQVPSDEEEIESFTNENFEEKIHDEL